MFDMTYRSIFMDPDWIHVRHMGWRDEWPDPGMRIMTRRDGPVERILVVSDLLQPDRATVEAAFAPWRSVLAEVTWHDLTGSAHCTALLTGLGFRRLNHERMLNSATVVIDLAQDSATLLAAMNSDTRRKLRQSERAGVICRGDCQDDPVLVKRFLDAHAAMAHQRGLARLSPGLVGSLFAAGRARLAGAFSATGDSAAFVLSYEAGETGFFLHGASDGPSDPLLGRAVHWHLMGALQASGLRWYDLGGLPNPDPSNGITRFKLGFGGRRIDLGNEYRWSGSLMLLVRRAARLLRRGR